MSLPEIKKYNNIDTLFVHGEPFIALAGEIHNSSASNLDYMENHVWANIKDLNMNALIVPVYWELVEPEQGKFDFSLIKGLIEQARNHGKHLILLWFGLWKNSESMYVPGWMRKDTVNYFRVRKVNGEPINTISPLCRKAVELDAKALAEVVGFIKAFDEKESTVITIQVENEIGVLGTDRDYSGEAEKAFKSEIPQILQDALDIRGTWREAFEEKAEEAFMCYYYAAAVEVITKSAQSVYPIPYYANAWLEQYPWYAGSYPCGGPVASMHKIWKLVAPSLFCLAPDIYVPYVPRVMDEYACEGNPLFIPEVRKDAVTASYCLHAFAKHNAICYSPFGIEELALSESEIEKPPMEVMVALNIDPSAFETDGSKDYLARVYGFMQEAKDMYFKYRGTSKMQAYVKTGEHDFGSFLKFSNYNMQVSYAPKMSHKPVASGMIIELDENRFYVIGMMSAIKLMPKPGENLRVDILKYEEGRFEKSQWIPGRVMNGDEKMMIRLGDQLSCYYVELMKY